jgi:hypothetical protein
MPRVSRWQAQHKGCQVAVDRVKADLMAEIERLQAELKRRDATDAHGCAACTLSLSCSA